MRVRNLKTTINSKFIVLAYVFELDPVKEYILVKL